MPRPARPQADAAPPHIYVPLANSEPADGEVGRAFATAPLLD
jgi:hypothetical protein